MPEWYKNYPTMLTREEMRLLAWIAEHVAIEGDIVDLGCFLGGSTVSLALGTTRSNAPKRVHAYDVFEINDSLEHQFLTKRGHQAFGGSDAFPIFKHFTQYYASTITAHAGDITQIGWDGDNIALLFIDISKTKALNDFLLLHFFPALQPGSIIIQQDFLLYQNPWLFPTMYKLRDSVDLLSYAEDYSAVFGVRRSLSAKQLNSCLSLNTCYEDTVTAIDYYRGKFTDVRQIEMVDALAKSFAAAPSAAESWNLPNVANIPISFDSD